MEDLNLAFVSDLAIATESKILLLVSDGLGGLPHPEFGYQTELEYAVTPNLDEFVSDPGTATGLLYPVGPGITPGSGPGHLGLFGYDPLNPKYNIGRGVLEASGLDITLKRDDIVFRLNFCQVAEDGRILDRRAGRLKTEESKPLCERLQNGVRIRGVEIVVAPARDYRATLIIRGRRDLSDRVTDTDPQKEGLKPLPCEPLDAKDTAAHHTAEITNAFIAQAAEILRDQPSANMVLARGASKLPDIPDFEEAYNLHAAATANYPLYRGIARLVGMQILAGATNLAEQLELVRDHLAEYTFFFVHFKDADSAGEDGDFLRKAAALELLDKHLPMINALNFTVVAITGDHSTPSLMKGHSWHPVPVAMKGPHAQRDDAKRLTEYDCGKGSLGRLPACELLRVMMATAGKLRKFGA